MQHQSTRMAFRLIRLSTVKIFPKLLSKLENNLSNSFKETVYHRNLLIRLHLKSTCTFQFPMQSIMPKVPHAYSSLKRESTISNSQSWNAWIVGFHKQDLPFSDESIKEYTHISLSIAIKDRSGFKSLNAVFPHHTSCQNHTLLLFPTTNFTWPKNLFQPAFIPHHKQHPWGLLAKSNVQCPQASQYFAPLTHLYKWFSSSP